MWRYQCFSVEEYQNESRREEVDGKDNMGVLVKNGGGWPKIAHVSHESIKLELLRYKVYLDNSSP